MTFYNIADVEGFMNAVGDCRGNVNLITSDGNVISLKSKLFSYVTISKLVGAECTIKEIELGFDDPEDEWKLLNFISPAKEKFA